MDATTRAGLELAYRLLIRVVIELSRILDKPSPITTRAERRATMRINESEEG